MNTLNILVTDATYKHALGIVRSLGKNGYKPFVLSSRKKSVCSYSKYAKGEILINQNYTKEELTAKLLEHKIDLIILVGTNSFKKIVPWKKDLEKENIHIVSVDEDKLNIAFSKKETYAYAERVGVPIPRTYYPKKIKELDTIKDKITYPCVIKGLYEVGGNIVDYAANKNELKSKYVAICQKYHLTEEEGLPMLQEYITGVGCAFFAVYNQGECGFTFQHKRVREYPVSGGASVCAESYKNDLVEKYGKKLLDALSWHGVAMVEFKLNTEGTPVLMEINPKFWGSTDLALEAGVDFPKSLVDIYLGKTVPFTKEYQYPLRYHWPLDGEILHLISNPKSLFPIIIDSLNPKVKSNIWLFEDPMPSFRMIFKIVNFIVGKITKRVK